MNQNKFPIVEIFNSCQGEGILAGVPQTFIRFAECNLRCQYCDTKYSWNTFGEMKTLSQIVEEISKLPKSRWIYLTGGEPLINPNLMELVGFLKQKHYKVAIATNGSILAPEGFYLTDFWTIDVKCPSAKVGNPSKVEQWGKNAQVIGEMKFVVGTIEDLEFVKKTIYKYEILQRIVISPVLVTGNSDIDKEWSKYVWSFCIENNLRFSLQLHKILFENKKGV